jgi:hypothetical protein
MSKLGQLSLSLWKQSFIQYLSSPYYIKDVKLRKELHIAETFENVYEGYQAYGNFTIDLQNFAEGIDELIGEDRGFDVWVKLEEEIDSNEEIAVWAKDYFTKEFHPVSM